MTTTSNSKVSGNHLCQWHTSSPPEEVDSYENNTATRVHKLTESYTVKRGSFSERSYAIIRGEGKNMKIAEL